MMNDAEIDELGGDKAGGLWLPARAPERAADCLANIRHALDEGATAEDYVRRYDNERAMLIMAGIMTPAGDWAAPVLDNDFAAKFGIGAGSERAVVYLALSFFWGTDSAGAWEAEEVAGWFDGFYDAIKRLGRRVAAVPLAVLSSRWAVPAREQKPAFIAQFGGAPWVTPRVRWYLSEDDAEELWFEPYIFDLLDDDERPYDLAVKALIDVSHYALAQGARPRLVAARLRGLAEDARAARVTDNQSKSRLWLYGMGLEKIADFLSECE